MYKRQVYVTHDQLEAMQMGDKIVVMNHGVVEQFGVPQQIYDWPATMFVADFIGSPPMNFLRWNGTVVPGAREIALGEIPVAVPESREGAAGELVLGVRPEHVRLVADGGYRGTVRAAEYLGTTQIVTVETAHGTLKARAPSGDTVAVGAPLGVAFDARSLTLFDARSGRALRSAGNEGVLAHG